MSMPSEEEVLTALAITPEGWYTSAELLPYFENLAPGGQVPTVKEVGEGLFHNSCLDRRKRKGVALWHVTRRGLDCRAWFKETTPEGQGG